MTENEDDQKACFDELKPSIDSLYNLPSQMSRADSRIASILLNEMLEKLKDMQDPESTLTSISTHSMIVSLLYVYKSMIKTDKNGFEIVIEPWLKIMHFLLTKTLIKLWMKPQFTVQLFILFSSFLEEPLRNKKEQQIIPKFSEEIKHLTVQCLSVVLPAKYKEGRYDSFSSSPYFLLSQTLQEDFFVPIASQCIMKLLNTIRYEQNIDLRLDALRLLSQLLHDNLRDINVIVMSFPGVTSSLCATIAQKSEKENHKVMCSALDTLGELIQAVMCDDKNNTLTEIDSFSDIFNKRQKEAKNEVITESVKTVRNEDWYKQTKEKLLNVLSQVLQPRQYLDWRTRLAFVEFSYTVLSSCSRTLDNCIKPLVEVLVMHIDDDYNEVSITCRIRMQSLLSSPAFERTIVPILKSNLYDWIMKFPQFVISKDEREKTIAISIISGFIILLGDQSESVLSTVLSRASDGWMTALEIDKESLHILEEKQSERYIELKDDNLHSSPIYPKIRFKHFVTDATANKLIRLLNIIGKYCDLQAWIYHFMRYVSMDFGMTNDPQAAYIVHALLSGALAHDTDATSETNGWIVEEDINNSKNENVKVIATQLLNDTMNILVNTAMTDINKTLSLATNTASFQLDEEVNHVLTVCFSLQIVGLTTCVINHEHLQDQLITMLYPLLAHLGSSNIYIHTYSLITLNIIAITCGLSNARELAIQNIDYIINMISQHISVLTNNARVPLVLKALIHVGGYDAINYLDDTIQEIYDALERYSLNDWLCAQLCSVLFEIIQTLEKNVLPGVSLNNYSNKANNADTNTTFESDNQMSNEIKSFIDNFEINIEHTDKEHGSMEEIGKYFLDRQAKGLHDNITLEKALLETNLPMDLPEDDSRSEHDEEDKNPLSHEQEIAYEIMSATSNFLTTSSPQFRSQILALLTLGVSILSDHPNQLNQLVHGMWETVVNRFDDPQNYVILHAATFIERVSQVSTDFLSRKFKDDLWPRFKTILRKGVDATISDPTSTGYSIYSIYHRTQICLLRTLTRVAYYVPMRQDIIKEILEETKYYYKNNQVHEELSSACYELFQALSTQRPDTVWIYEMSQLNHDHNPPSSLLDSFQVPKWLKSRLPLNNDFTFNRTSSLIKFK